MNRRNFLRHSLLAAGATYVAARTANGAIFTPDDTPSIAITIDDPNTKLSPLKSWQERNEGILQALQNHQLKAALFVCGKRIDSEEGKALLKRWDDAGHVIANHSYSHLYYNSPKMDFPTYRDDLLHGETIINSYKNFTKLFRYPFLKEGDTAEKRDAMRAFLNERGYQIGAVSLDTSDWYVDERLKAALEKNQQIDLTPYKNFYLNHLWDRAQYYNGLANRLGLAPVQHVILLHHTLLNSLFLDDVIGMFKAKGWKVVNADTAFHHSLYARRPKIAPAGESILWAAAKEAGTFEKELRYPGEDGDYEKEKMDSLGL